MSQKMEYKLRSTISHFEKDPKCDLTALKTLIRNISDISPNSIERASIRNINSNSIFLIGKLDWDNNLSDEHPLMSCLSSFVNNMCSAQNAYAGLFLKQAWKLFSVCVYATIDERLVQAASLIDSCISLACINYCTNGDIHSCQEGLKLLFFQKFKKKDSYLFIREWYFHLYGRR